MITSVGIKNFRSIADMELNLGRITVLTGANNSGKSSVIYALLTLKNAVTNPNQVLDSVFNLGFINLGGFKETVYRKQIDQSISIMLKLKLRKDRNAFVDYSLRLKPNASYSAINLPLDDITAGVLIDFPYKLDNVATIKSDNFPPDTSILWNGISGTLISERTPNQTVFAEDLSTANKFKRERLIKDVNSPLQTISHTDFIPIRRGFTKPFFSPIPLTQQITNEDEIATLLYADRELASDVAHHLEKIVDRRFSVVPVANTTNFYLQTRDEKTGFTADLVNEGLGTNQLVTILAKALYKNASFICIDEPEIHLHPSIIDKLVNVLIDITNERNKQFLISTHSEHFINALLSAVIKKRITPEEVKVYHLTKEGWDTKAEEQKINADGQIEGGLSHFYAAELESWKTFFKLD